jgi:NTE family protein
MQKEAILKNEFLDEKSKQQLNLMYEELNAKEFSDILDKDGNQYVHLVQEGGGVWGTALVGYLYALEIFGLRFLRIAGTSAGAINTILIAAIGNREEMKSEKIKAILFDWDLSTFIDGNSIVKKVLSKIVDRSGWVKKIKILAIAILVFLLLFPIVASITDIKNWKLFTIPIILIVIFYFVFYYYYTLFKTSRFGLNPGNSFYSKLEETINKENENAFFSVSELYKKYYKEAEQLNVYHRLPATNGYFEETKTMLENLHKEFKENIDEDKYVRFINNLNNEYEKNPLLFLKADYTIVTTDINAKIKIELPKMANLYWGDDEMKTLSPAAFVRCSMAIPFFFEPYIKTIDKNKADIIFAHKFWLNSTVENSKGIFIDGGSISNFPIDIFHEREILNARVPVIGVRLFDSPKKQIDRENFLSTLGSYAGQIIDTMRGYNDRTFLHKYGFYTKHSIKEIDCAPSNWLNFFMKKEEKNFLYNTGFRAGLDFLKNFNWKDYKHERMILSLKERTIIKD